MKQSIFFFLKDFIYLFDRDRDSQWEREHRRGSGRGRSRLLAEEPDVGARSQNAGIPLWAKGRRLMTVPPRRPSFLYFNHFFLLSCLSSFHILFYLFYFLKDFIYLLDRERHSKRRNTSRGSGRGRSSFPTEKGAPCGAQSQDPGIMTELKAGP